MHTLHRVYRSNTDHTQVKHRSQTEDTQVNQRSHRPQRSYVQTIYRTNIDLIDHTGHKQFTYRSNTSHIPYESYTYHTKLTQLTHTDDMQFCLGPRENTQFRSLGRVGWSGANTAIRATEQRDHTVFSHHLCFHESSVFPTMIFHVKPMKCLSQHFFGDKWHSQGIPHNFQLTLASAIQNDLIFSKQ